MARRFGVIAVVVVLLATGGPIAVADPAVTIAEITGRVEARIAGGSWQRVRAGELLPLGATISTGFGSSAVLQAGSARIEVEQLTRMRIDELLSEGGVERSDLYLEVGRVRAEVQAVENVQPDFRLRSPVSTAAVRGTSFLFDGYSLQVRQGWVQLLNRSGRWVTVGGGERSRSDGVSDATKPIREVERRVVTTPYIPGPEPRRRGAERTVRTSSTGSIVIEWSIADPPD